MPGGQGNRILFGIPHFDKIGHFGMYAIWTFFIYRAFSHHAVTSSGRSVFYTVLLGAVTGVALEFGQLYMNQGRSFEMADMVANAVGALCGTAAGYYFFSRNVDRGRSR